MSDRSSYLTALRYDLDQHFSLEEIRALGHQLEVGDFPGTVSEKSSLVEHLVGSLEQNGRLPDLIALVRGKRPDVNWPAAPNDEVLSPEPGPPSGDVVGGDKVGGDKITVGDISDGTVVAIGAGAKAVYQQGLSVEEVAALVVELKEQDQALVWDGRIPYLGLTAFQESDAEFFFGRESLVTDLLERVGQASFIAIAGPSGSGKSSVARAGLLYALRSGRLEKSDTWLLGAMQPKGDPTEQLALAVSRLAGSPTAGNYLRQAARTNPLALQAQVESLLTDDPQQRCVLLVDQFEETFTQTKDEAEREAFINLLTGAAEAEASRTIIIISLRSDFVSHCARFPELRTLMSREFQLVGAMEPRDLAKAITMPALEVGAEIDPALVSRIMADMKGEPGALPLMSFALRDLFEAEKTQKGQPMDMTLTEYLNRGGIDSALERHANRVFDNFTHEEKALAQSIFPKLIEVGQGRVDTRRTATFAELVPAGVDGGLVTEVVSRLAQEGVRLVTTSGGQDDEIGAEDESGQPTVTIAHEKLIDAWPWLRQLVDENREIIALQNQINSDARAWDKDQDAGFLYRGGRLLQVEEKLTQLNPKLDALSQRFIQASLEEKEAERQAEAERIQQEEALRQERANAGRFRRLTRLLGAAATVAVIATIVALFFLNTARQESEEAIAARSTSDANAQIALTREAEANIAKATSAFNAELAATSEAEALGAQMQAEEQRQIMSLMAQSQALLNVRNVRIPDYETIAQSRLMAVAAYEIDQETTGGQNSSLLTPWNYNLSRAFPLSFQPVFSFTNQISIVLSVAWNADNSRFASAGVDGAIAIWQPDESQADSWQPLTTLSGHTAEVNSVVWNVDGSRLASGSNDGNVIIWETADWQSLAILTHDADVVKVNSVAWNPDGNLLASADTDGTLIIWQPDETRPNNWQRLNTFSVPATIASKIAWNADGSQLAFATYGSIIVWDTDAWQEETVIDRQASRIYDVLWSPDNDRLVTTHSDGNIIIWDTTGWQSLTTLTAHPEEINDIAWSANGSLFASVSTNNAIIIWDTISWQPLANLTGHAKGANSLAWNADGSLLISAGEDGIFIWDTSGWRPQTSLTDHTNEVWSAEWNPDGTLLASASRGDIVIWDTTDLQPLRSLTEHSDWIESVAWNPNGGLLASASWDDTLIIWDTTNWLPVITLPATIGELKHVAWQPDGGRLAAAASAGVVIWDTDNWEPLATLSQHDATVNNVAWNPDGSRLASASWDDTIIIWDTISWQPITTLTNHTDRAHYLAWSPDGNRLASASFDNTIIIWDTTNWKPLATLTAHTDAVTSVDWNADGTRLASSSRNGVVIVWSFAETEAASWQPLLTLLDHTAWVNSVAWNDDGKRLATAADDGTVIITRYEDSVSRNCALAHRNFTWDEWQSIFPNEPYQVFCPGWPVHPSVPVEERPQT